VTHYDSSWISNQPGANAGLHTHTTVDWAGSQDAANPQLEPPDGWPTDAYMADPDEGNRPAVDDPVPPLVLPPFEPSTESASTGPDNEPGLDDSQIIAQFLKPDLTTVWLQKDHAAYYLAKGYELTGDEFNVDEYNDSVRELDAMCGIKNGPQPTWPPS
jgi:hypothetical protein